MDKPQVKFDDWFREGVDLYRDNLKVLVLASAIAVALSWLTLGILSGPMMAGLSWMMLRLLDKDDPKPVVGDVFKGFSWFVQAFLFVAAWGLAVMVGSVILAVVPVVGSIASTVLGFAVGTFLMFGMFLIIEDNQDFWTASKNSAEVVKQNYWPFLGLFFITSLIAMAGGVLFFIGMALTVPLQVAVLAVAYRKVFAQQETDALAAVAQEQ